jgi:hypothetical protein
LMISMWPSVPLEPGRQYYILAEGTWSYTAPLWLPTPGVPDPPPPTTYTHDAEWSCTDNGTWYEQTYSDLIVWGTFSPPPKGYGGEDYDWLGSSLPNPDPVRDFNSFNPHTYSPSHCYWLPIVLESLSSEFSIWSLNFQLPLVIRTDYASGGLYVSIYASSDAPTGLQVKTLGAVNIGRACATLFGQVVNDGGQPCQYRFRYKQSGGSYLYTPWTGSVTSGQYFNETVADLSPGTTYHFVAEAKNTTGESTGTEQSFTTLELWQAGITGIVVERDATGQPKGPLDLATVDLTGEGITKTATTISQGQFTFNGLNPGTYTIAVSKSGYYSPPPQEIILTPGDMKSVMLYLTPQSSTGEPVVTDFSSPDGKHFVEGLPSTMSFAATTIWNGSPGVADFIIAGMRYPATITDLGNGQAKITLTIPVPLVIPAYSELVLEISNGEGKKLNVKPGIHFYPLPGIVMSWYGNTIPWTTGLTHSMDGSWVIFDAEEPIFGIYSAKASAGYQHKLSFDPLAGILVGYGGGFGKYSHKLAFSGVENFSNGKSGHWRAGH